MKRLLTLLVLSMIIMPPVSVFASECNNDGYAIVFVNGILNDKGDADESKTGLEDYLKGGSRYSDQITFHLGYNPTRLKGAGDVSKSILQKLFMEDKYESLDLDATIILKKLHKEISNQKILLLGHSQGTFYTNNMYHYLINKGVNKESIAVYNIATPASYVAGEGGYLTSGTDNIIETVRSITRGINLSEPLKSNTNILIQDNELNNFWRGHNLQKVYLIGQGKRIVTEIDDLLTTLTTSGSASKASCYTEPSYGVQAGIENGLLNGPGIVGEASATLAKKGVDATVALGTSATHLAQTATQRLSATLLTTTRLMQGAWAQLTIGLQSFTLTDIYKIDMQTSTRPIFMNPLGIRPIRSYIVINIEPRVVEVVQEEYVVNTEQEQQETVIQTPLMQEVEKLPQQATLEPVQQTQEQHKETLTELDARMRLLGDSVYRDLAQYREERLLRQAQAAAIAYIQKCEGIDLSIIEHSTCLSPFEEGGYGFGAGGTLVIPVSSGPPPKGNQNAGPG